MLEVLRNLVDESSVFFADEVPDLLDENSIAWRREHEFFIGDFYCLILEINDEYFQFNEDERMRSILDVIQVKPNVITKVEYVEVE